MSTSREGLQVVEVESARKGFAGASNDEYQRRRSFHFVERVKDFVNQFEADGVTLIGPVEREQSDAVFVGESNGVVGHEG